MTDYGTDLASTFGAGGVVDCDPYFRRITGNEAIAHAVIRRLVTPRGSLSWDPHCGFDVRAYLNAPINRQILGFLQGAIKAEALADERVATADVSVSFNDLTSKLTVTLTLTAGDGPFTLVLAVSALTVSILSLT